MRVATLVLALATLGTGCSVLTHFDEYRGAGGSDGGRMDAGPRPDANPGDCGPLAESCNGMDDDCDAVIDEGADSVCSLGVNATGTCTMGACVYDCDDGYADCDETMPGCEAHLGAATSCGSCGEQCMDPTPSCSDGACIARCPAGEMDCGGTCADVRSDASHCGMCGNACAVANGTAACVAGSCTVDACDTGWADCDRMVENGCEQSLDAIAHCGGCGVLCDPANATESCIGGVCRIVSCAAGFADCSGGATDGCESSLTTVLNCGMCGRSCDDTTEHASVACDPSTLACVYTCDANWANCDGTPRTCETDLTRPSSCGACGRTCSGACVNVDGSWTCAGDENCTNGVDDNSDMLVDCADPDCTAYGCVPPPPAGWSGPVMLYDGAITGAPSCPAPFTGAYDGNGAFMAGTHSCAPCACGGASGITCSAPTVTLYQGDTAMVRPDSGVSSGCDGCATMQASRSATCTAYAPSPACMIAELGSIGADVGVSTPSGGSCSPSGGSPTISSPTWGSLGRACAPPSGASGCGTQRCVPNASSPWLRGYCVFQAGTPAACPAGFTVRHTFYEGFSDTRGCGACTCSMPATGATCSGDVAFYDNSTGAGGCSSFLTSMGSAAPCRSLGRPSVEFMFTGERSASGGTCMAGGGARTGTASPTTATTFCCI